MQEIFVICLIHWYNKNNKTRKRRRKHGTNSSNQVCSQPNRVYACWKFENSFVCIPACKKNDGKFILRIEDTDRERYVEGAVDIIYNTLRQTGLVWDEGPDIGGPYGPYVQSERMGMFKEYAEQLVKSGHAYYCFCDKERLEELKKIQQASNISPKYDGTAGT